MSISNGDIDDKYADENDHWKLSLLLSIEEPLRK
jgi:hypothetical protein